MQSSFAFSGHDDIAHWHRLLAPLRRSVELLPPRPPVGQLVKSMIGGRTRDAVSQAAYGWFAPIGRRGVSPGRRRGKSAR